MDEKLIELSKKDFEFQPDPGEEYSPEYDYFNAYLNTEEVLPSELITVLQNYCDGYIYIPTQEQRKQFDAIKTKIYKFVVKGLPEYRIQDLAHEPESIARILIHRWNNRKHLTKPGL